MPIDDHDILDFIRKKNLSYNLGAAVFAICKSTEEEKPYKAQMLIEKAQNHLEHERRGLGDDNATTEEAEPPEEFMKKVPPLPRERKA